MRRDNSLRRRTPRAGFTLIEVLLVLVILGFIAALVVPRLVGSQERAMVMATETRIKTLEAKLELYAVDHQAKYPESLDELMSPVDLQGNPMQPYEREFPKDAWDRPLNYELTTDDSTGGTAMARIWSNGPDGRNDNGSGDDINNWGQQDS